MALVRESLPLKRAGAAYKALCPFHREKTPSFTVNPARQIFKCFGCGEGGDIFSWVMKTENVTFFEAAATLAERAHIELPEAGREDGPPRGEKDQLYRVNRWAAENFHRWLVDLEVGKPALRYLEGRGITSEIIEQFQLGCSPDAWDTLLKTARRQNIPVELLTKAGLLSSNEQNDSVYDRFRNRLMFPIRDVRGRVIAFGARALDDSEPKYLNSPETPLFAKGRVLYAIDRAQAALKEKKQAVVVEGYMDVIAAHQHGVPWAVGVLGTALTQDHVRLLRRYVEEAILVFDADAAGQSSANRSIDAFAAEELTARVVSLPSGKDPDDFLRGEGTDAFLEYIDGAVEGVAHKLNRALDASAGASSQAQSRALDDVLATVALMPNAVTQSVEIRKIAERTRLPEHVLGQRVRRLTARTRPVHDDATFGVADDASSPGGRDLESELVEVLLVHPNALPCARERLDFDLLGSKDVRAVIARIFELAKSTGSIGPAEVLARTQEDSERRLIEHIIGKTHAGKVDPQSWCAELIDAIEARAHRHRADAVHERFVAGGASSADDVNDMLRAKLDATREAQRTGGTLVPKSL